MARGNFLYFFCFSLIVPFCKEKIDARLTNLLPFCFHYYLDIIAYSSSHKLFTSSCHQDGILKLFNFPPVDENVIVRICCELAFKVYLRNTEIFVAVQVHCKKKVLSRTSKKGSVDYIKFENVLKVSKNE